MSTTRDEANIEELQKQRDPRAPPPEWPQGLVVAAAGAGGGGGGGLTLPLDVRSPNQQLRLQISLTDDAVRVRLSHACGSEVLLRVLAGGAAAIRVLDCTRQGQLLGPNGLRAVTVTEDPTTGEEQEQTGPQLSPIVVTGCVNGQTKQITIYGYIPP